MCVLANEGADVSVPETIRRAQHEAESWTALHAEYQTLAEVGQADRWEHCWNGPASTHEQEQVRASEAHGPLLAAVRDAEAFGLDIETAFPKLVRARSPEVVASVLDRRVDKRVKVAVSRRRAAHKLIAGLVPRVMGITDPDMARGLQQRDKAMEQRARTLAEQAVAHERLWARKLGKPLPDPTVTEQWLRAVSTIAAYRERWGVDADNQSLGPESMVNTSEHVGHRNGHRLPSNGR